jgi:hypothetical protein
VHRTGACQRVPGRREPVVRVIPGRRAVGGRALEAQVRLAMSRPREPRRATRRHVGVSTPPLLRRPRPKR